MDYATYTAADYTFSFYFTTLLVFRVQYVKDRFENHPPSVGFRIGFAYPILIEWRITDSNR